MAESASHATECDPCKEDNTPTAAGTLCLECREFYCLGCSSKHRRFGVTRNHRLVALLPNSDEGNEKSPNCDPCKLEDTSSDAVTVCSVCRELYCSQCTSYHKKIKATRAHSVFDLPNPAEGDSSDVTSGFQGLRVSTTPNAFAAAQVQKDTIRPSSDADSAIPIKAVYCTEFSSRIAGDTEEGRYEVHRMVTLPDDRVIVLDIDNHKLKLFSNEYKFLHSVGVNGGTFGLTLVDKSTVAVSDATPNCITLYTLQGNTLHTSTSIQCGEDGGWLYDIAYSNEHFVCLKCGGEGDDRVRRIERVSRGGHRQTVVQEEGGCSLNFQVMASCYHMTDFKEGKVICMTYEGKLLWEVTTPSGPIGITLVRGTLCVVSFEKGVVSQISLDGEMYDHHVIQGLTKPECICYQSHRKRLLVSHTTPGALIKVYTVT